MQRLIKRIQDEAVYLGRGIIKVDGFLNHQIDPMLTAGMGHAFIERFTEHGVQGITKIVTAEVSGIAPAVATGMVLGVPVVYARKKRPVTMADGYFSAEAPSRTKGSVVTLMISPEYLKADDQVLIIDDFLATGLTIDALIDVVSQSGATIHGIGCVVEKVFTDGRARLAKHHVPVVSLAKIDLDGDQMRVF